MAKKQNPQIDEELMRQMIGGQVPLTGSVIIDPEEKSAPEPEPISNTTVVESRRRRSALPDFEQTFFMPVEYKIRSSLYVSADTKRKILEVVKKIGGERMTAISYVENILRHHLELYKDEINRIHKEQNSKNII